MSINYNNMPPITPDSVLIRREGTVDAIAMAAILNMIEGNIEMITDGYENYPTRDLIETRLNSADSQAIDFVHDAIDDLKAAVLERLRSGKLTVNVRSMRFDKTGALDDVDVDVAFE